QPVARPLATHAPSLPPGTRKGRCTPGCETRSRTRAAKMGRLARASSAIERVRTALKYFAFESPATANAAAAVTVETAPATTVARTGVPVRAEIAPSARGAAPSRLAATCVRAEPTSH